MVSSTSEPRDINLLDILWDDNDVPQLKQILANLSPDDKYKLLSSPDAKGAYLLHDVLYSICDRRRADIPENDPSLITSVLSGLNGEQRIHLLGLRDYNDYTPFGIFNFMGLLGVEHYPTILQNLMAELTPSERFKVLKLSQEMSGEPLFTAICWFSVESVRLIREGLSKDQWESILTINRNYMPLNLNISDPSMARALLEGFDSKERARLLTTPDSAGKLPITNSFGEGPPEVVTALLEGLNSDDIVRVLTTPDKDGDFPLLRAAQDGQWDMVGAISNCLNDDEYIKVLGCFYQGYFPFTSLIAEKNGPDIIERLLERLSPDQICTLLSSQDNEKKSMLSFMCGSEFFEEDKIGNILLGNLDDEQLFQLIKVCQAKDGFLNTMVNNHKEILQDLNEDEDLADEEPTINFLQVLSPNLRARIFDLPDKDGITPKDILNGDLKRIDEGRKIIESIRDLFMVSHDGATTPQLDIRSKLRSIGSNHGRRLEPS